MRDARAAYLGADAGGGGNVGSVGSVEGNPGGGLKAPASKPGIAVGKVKTGVGVGAVLPPSAGAPASTGLPAAATA